MLSSRSQQLGCRGLAAPSKFARTAAPRFSAQRSTHAVSRRASVVVQAGKAEKISGEQLEVEIANRDRMLIIDFFATWCGPCVLLSSELEKVAEKLGDRVKVLKIDVDENPELSSSLRIEGLPTIVFIPKENGKPALRTEGLLPFQQIIDIVNDVENDNLQKAPIDV